ncbi:GntR family transcriptional regulator [Mesorhizobium sp. SB112]|uniref:GntR family transcriptional regulator n=1 Tax=Mesorhizobium sp. SB112 TaxID=3151853 RepID=UPI003263FC56
MTSENTRSSVPDWVFNQLVRRIVTGELPAGSRITEEQLAADLGVSRTPLRSALQRLETARLVTKSRNRSIYVSPLRFDEIEELTAIRQRLEGLVAARAAERVAKGEIDTRRARLIAAQLDPRGLVSPEDIHSLGLNFHMEIAQLSGLEHVQAILRDLYLAMDRYRYMLAEIAERAEQRVAEHLAILDAIESGDPVRAEAAMTDHNRSALELYRQHLATVLHVSAGSA